MNTVDQLLPAAEESLDLPLRSLAKRQHDVFASNEHGLFWADGTEKRWLRLPIPPSMPMGGMLARIPEDSVVVLYSVNRWNAVPGSENRYGIYVSHDSGRTWDLLSERDDYASDVPVLLLPNRSLFAGTQPDAYESPTHLYLSSDMGRTWHLIWQGHNCGLCWIDPDPDHPGLIWLEADEVPSGYFAQAEDDRYLWNSDWEGPKNVDFFRSYYEGYDLPSALVVSLRNYFDHQFGNRTHLCPFDLSADRPRFEFRQGERVLVPVTIRLCENMPSAWHDWKEARTRGEEWPVPTLGAVTLIDDARPVGLWRRLSAWYAGGVIGYGVWGIHIEYDGEQISKVAPAHAAAYEIMEENSHLQYRHQREIRPELRRRFLGTLFRLSAVEPYKRTLDLGKLHDFSAPGVYRIQLNYDSGWAADRNAGEWLGHFTGSVFEVVISDSK